MSLGRIQGGIKLTIEVSCIYIYIVDSELLADRFISGLKRVEPSFKLVLKSLPQKDVTKPPYAE